MRNRLGCLHLSRSFFHSLSRSHTHTHTHAFHTHTEVRSLHLSKAPPNYELLRTIMSTMRGPWPHKSTHNQPQGLPHSHHCPMLHTHTHTMATPEPGVPLCNSITQRHTPVLIPSEREKNDRGGRRKIVTLGERWRKMSETQSAKCVCGRSADNIFGRERHTVGKLLLCMMSLSLELNQSLAQPLRYIKMWIYDCVKCR